MNSLVISGAIDFRIYEKAINTLSDNGSILIADSPGGDGRAIILLSGFVQAKKIAVTVSGYCLSGCASDLFPSSPDATLLPNAILGFHTTISANDLVAHAHHFSIIHKEYSKYVALEDELYRNSKINNVWRFIPEFYVNPACYKVDNTMDAGSFVIVNQYNLYLPTNRELKSMGFRYSGSLPEGVDSIGGTLDLIRQRTGKQYVWTFSKDPKTYPDMTFIREAALKIPQCLQ